MDLPDWLPESTILKTEKHKLFVEYTLRAQFIPRSKRMYAVDVRFPKKYENISLFRGSRKIYVYKQYEEPPSVNMNFSIKQQVG